MAAHCCPSHPCPLCSPVRLDLQPGQIQVIPRPLSEEDVRRIIREELARDREAKS